MKIDKSRIQSCVDHINTAIDVDPWAKELVIEMGKEILEQLNNSTTQTMGQLNNDDIETIRIHLSAIKEQLANQHRWKEAQDYQRLIDRFMAFAEQPEPLWGKTVEVGRPLADREVVSRLRDIQKQVGGSYAIDRAIEAIEAVQALPSVQPVDKDINVSCKDAITRAI